ncbi:IPT/TIG domain-containing protein [Streptomyces phaeochromogenes]
MGLYKKNNTRIKQAAFPAVAVSDPLMRVTEDVYETKAYGPGDGRPEGSRHHLLYQVGSIVPQSEIDRLYTVATIASVSPATGPVAGGAVVTIKGTGLDGVTAVNFGAAAGTELKVVSATELRVKTPAVAASTVNVIIAADTGNVTKTAGFVYA